MWKVATQENLSGRQIEVDDIQAVLDRLTVHRVPLYRELRDVAFSRQDTLCWS